jgi:hypothetical protein
MGRCTPSVLRNIRERVMTEVCHKHYQETGEALSLPEFKVRMRTSWQTGRASKASSRNTHPNGGRS